MAQLGPSKNTKCELAVFEWLDGRGIQFIKHPSIPGCRRRSADALILPDLFVFVYGRFWHDPNGRTKTMSERWTELLKRNVARDESTQNILRSRGFRFVVLWDDKLEDGFQLLEQAFGAIPPGVESVDELGRVADCGEDLGAEKLLGLD